MRLKGLQVIGGVHVKELPFAGNLDGAHALLVRLGDHAAALAGWKRSQLVERPSGKEHGSARRAPKACAPDAIGVALGAAKKRSEAVCADEWLITLNERDCVAVRHLLHSQAHGVVS